MADTVRHLMEGMIPELEELEKKGYFSRKEVKQIVQRREDFEYLLKRRAALQQDFYRYIDYETKLEELRRFRKKKLGIKGKTGLAEVAAVRRIHFIYERCTRKFKGDLDLWLRWIKFCKESKSTKQLSKVVTKALQRHSNVPLLWVEAAVWEYEQHSNMTAARTLMQQGLRMCKSNQDMWVEYFRFELLYASKLVARRKLLGIDNGSGAGGDGESDQAVAAVLSGAIAGVVYKRAIASCPDSLAFRVRFLDVLAQYDLADMEALRGSIYDGIKADFAEASKCEEAWDVLAQRHLSTVTATSSGSSNANRNGTARAGQDGSNAANYDSDTGTEHEAAGEAEAGAGAGGASSKVFDAQQHKDVCATYEAALQAVHTPRMYELYAGYLHSTLLRLQQQQQGGNGGVDVEEGDDGQAAQSAQVVEACVAVATEYFALANRAHVSQAASPELYLAWLATAVSLGQDKVALKAARQACQRHPRHAGLWASRLQLEVRLHGSSRHSSAAMLDTFKAALTALPLDETYATWLQALDTFPAASAEYRAVCDELVRACMAVPAADVESERGDVALHAVHKLWEACGAEAGRKLYRRLLQCPAPGLSFIRGIINLEKGQQQQQQQSNGVATLTVNGHVAKRAKAAGSAGATSEEQQQQQRAVDELFESGVSAYGSCCADLWLEYLQWQLYTGRGAGRLVWRAQKALPDPSHFMERCRQVQVAA